jgi:hypothetical protein
MLELRIMNAGQAMPLFDLPAALGRRKAARELGDTIEGLIAFVDALAGDPDLEDGGDDEPTGDERDASAKEWEPERRGRRVNEVATRVSGRPWLTEDNEDDDPTEDDDEDRCAAGDDAMTSGPACDYFEGCTKGSPGNDDDAERGQSPSYRIDQTKMLLRLPGIDVARWWSHPA